MFYRFDSFLNPVLFDLLFYFARKRPTVCVSGKGGFGRKTQQANPLSALNPWKGGAARPCTPARGVGRGMKAFRFSKT